MSPAERQALIRLVHSVGAHRADFLKRYELTPDEFGETLLAAFRGDAEALELLKGLIYDAGLEREGLRRATKAGYEDWLARSGQTFADNVQVTIRG